MENRCSISLVSNHIWSIHGTTRPLPWPLSLKEKDGSTPNSHSSEQAETTNTEKQHFYRCKQCKIPVAHQGTECSIGDQKSHSMQVNPHGYLHQVLTVKDAFNVFFYGNFVPADSWFPGYLWRLCLCIQCANHIGWSYHLPDQQAYSFIGLRRASILKD